MKFGTFFKKGSTRSAEEPKDTGVKSPAKEVSRSNVSPSSSPRAARYLIRPVVSEKASFLGKNRQYVFETSLDANKIEVARAIEEAYGIRPSGVRVIRVHPKEVRSGRVRGRRKEWKKMMVTLPPGKSLSLYEGV